MVGFSAFGKHPENGTAWIVRYMTGAQYQRQGFGRKGLRAVLDHMRKEYDCPAIYLDVGPENVAAISLYEDAGFVATGESQGKSDIYRLDFE